MLSNRNYNNDLSIVQRNVMDHILKVAEKLGIPEDSLELYGKYIAKIPLQLIDADKVDQSKLVLVTAMTPTPAGEGKTTVSIGLSDGLNKIGVKSTVVLREPSLGPVFGMKGGAAGGGHSQVVPMEDINLHFTGDFAAVEKSNNLLASLIDNNIQSKTGNLELDPRTVEWKRVMDMNDRALRSVVTGMGGKTGGIMRETGFNITAASEIMAILCLCEGLDDLKKKIGNIYVGDTYGGEAVFARDLRAEGAMTALLKNAIKPNLVQTLEANPAIIHGGPFANIAQGTNSVIATKMGMTFSDYVVTEAGFGADLGAEKFMNIKCGYSGLTPHCIVLVATVRALKYHGGKDREHLHLPDVHALEKGLPNLDKHIENIRAFHVPGVVAINKFPGDTVEEIERVKEFCSSLGIKAVVSEGWEKGGAGAVGLARAVLKVGNKFSGRYQPLYDWGESIPEKVEKIAKKIYGASQVEFLPRAKQNLRKIARIGMSDKPVCMAKTQNSLSDDPKWLGKPENFTLTVREIEIAAGAGFVVPITANMMRMPGLPPRPSAEEIDIDNEGKITGLS
ncbi:MAG: formate--tetrahydrofolate ligase [Cyclobacteriaceae bacterium]|nr:formate--tetrahydrofolate ligase [Cyclobacteriaceae bacterium]